MYSWSLSVNTIFGHGSQLLCLQGRKWGSLSQFGHHRLGKLFLRLPLPWPRLAWFSALEFISCSGVRSSLPYFPMRISCRDNLSWTGGLVPHLKFSPTLREPKLWRAYLKARVDTLLLPAESSLFCPPHLQRPWPGKTCLNLGTPARPHLQLLPTCWGQTEPEIQLVSCATLVPPPTRPSALRLEAPYGGLHFRTSQ